MCLFRCLHSIPIPRGQSTELCPVRNLTFVIRRGVWHRLDHSNDFGFFFVGLVWVFDTGSYYVFGKNLDSGSSCS